MPNPSTLAWIESAKAELEALPTVDEILEKIAKNRTQGIIDDMRARNVWPYNRR